MNADQQKVIVFGLDCATPQLVFDRYISDLPFLSSLMQKGVWGNLRSTTPAITVPAWMSMLSSRDPGDIGVYGFRSRKAGSAYDSIDIATSSSMKRVKKVWDYLGDEGLRSSLLGVPGTYPPSQINGKMVTCFLTPDSSVDFTYPQELKKEVLDACGSEDYIFDVANRTQTPPEVVLKQIYAMTRQRIAVMQNWINKGDWEFLMYVEMGVDRIHHYLWQYMDPTHKEYVAGNIFEQQIRDYYRFVDTELQKLMALAPHDAIVYVVSDHGAKRMDGMFVINEWLMKEGYLVLKEYPQSPRSIEKCDVDWSKTRAWAWGGFYSRLFINVEGREPQGCVPQAEVAALIQELRDKLSQVPGPDGKEIVKAMYTAPELYPSPTGDVPDLLIFWGDLYYKVAGTIGYHALYIDHDDRGLDYGVHDWDGIFMKYDPRKPEQKGKREGLNILDVAPTILHDFGIEAPSSMRGKIIE